MFGVQHSNDQCENNLKEKVFYAGHLNDEPQNDTNSTVKCQRPYHFYIHHSSVEHENNTNENDQVPNYLNDTHKIDLNVKLFDFGHLKDKRQNSYECQRQIV